MKDLAHESHEALPELKDIDGAEAGQLAEASYEVIKSIVLAIAA